MTLLMSLNSMKSTFAHRLEKLKNDDFQTWLVVDWLRKDGHKRFQKPVFLPPLLSLGIKEKSLATLAESCLRPHDLIGGSLSWRCGASTPGGCPSFWAFGNPPVVASWRRYALPARASWLRFSGDSGWRRSCCLPPASSPPSR